jgi:hypothetical protein
LAEAVALDLQDVIRSASHNGTAATVEAQSAATDDSDEMDGDHRRTVVDVLTHTVLDLRECATSADGNPADANETQS